MPYLRTHYRQTGEFVDPAGLLGPAYLAGSLVSGAGISMRNPTPVIVASLSIQGSVYADAYSIMAMYYGSGVMPSGYVLTPINVALASQGVRGSFPPAVIAPLTSVLSLARSLGGHSGEIGYGLFNSGSTSRFLVLAWSAGGGGTYTFVSAENAIVTFLVASAPAYIT
mgnify:CR=1 FL=1